MAIAVPGELKGYSTAYKSYGGGVSWESLFEPTIKLCEEGMKVSDRLAHNLKNHEQLVKNDTMLRYEIRNTLNFIKYNSVFVIKFSNYTQKTFLRSANVALNCNYFR